MASVAFDKNAEKEIRANSERVARAFELKDYASFSTYLTDDYHDMSH